MKSGKLTLCRTIEAVVGLAIAIIDTVKSRRENAISDVSAWKSDMQTRE